MKVESIVNGNGVAEPAESPPGPPKRHLAVIYGRVSKDKLGATNDAGEVMNRSIELQMDTLAQYIKFRKMEVVSTYDDVGVSGGKQIEKRPGGSEALKDIFKLNAIHRKNPGVTTNFVVTAPDRLGRTASEVLTLCEEFFARGITLHVCDMAGNVITADDPDTYLLFGIRILVAHWERKKCSQRQKKMSDHKLAKNEQNSPPVFGWDMVKTGRFTKRTFAGNTITKEILATVENPEEQKWIMWMIDRRKAGLSYKAIGDKLGELGVMTKIAKKPLWNQGTVFHILNNVRVRNKYGVTDVIKINEDTVEEFEKEDSEDQNEEAV